MYTPELPEQERPDSRKPHWIADTLPDTEFDRLLRLVAWFCGTPIAAMSLFGENGQWFKSLIGLDLCEPEYALAFCNRTVHGKCLHEIPDVKEDPEYLDHPLVTGEPGLRFYAGLPLLSANGHVFGVLALMDFQPRTLDAEKKEALQTIAGLVVTMLELSHEGHMLRRLLCDDAPSLGAGASASLALDFDELLERKKTLEAVREAEERFRNVAKAVTDTIWDWDLKADTIWWNEGMQTAFGYPPEEVMSGSESWTERIHADDRVRVLDSIHSVINGRDERWSEEYRFIRKDGSSAHVLDRGFVIRSLNNTPIRMVGGMADLSYKKKADEETQLAAMIQAGIADAVRRISATDLDLQGVMDLMVERALTLTGATGAAIELVEGDEFIYRATAGTARSEAGRKSTTMNSLSGLAVRSECILYSHDAETDDRVDRVACRKVNARSLIVAPLRNLTVVIGVLEVMAAEPNAFTERDIHNLQIMGESLGSVIQRHFALEQLRVSEAQYRMLFDNNPHPMWVYEMENLRILAVNKSAITHYGYTEQEFLSMTLRDLRPAEEIDALEKTVLNLNPRGKSSGTLWKHLKRNGTIITVEIISDAIDFNGKPARLVMANDVTERIRAEHEIQQLAFYDSLTQLPNRVLLMNRLQQAMAGSARTNRMGALLFIDLDNFKLLNDTHGHSKGDLLLKQVARRLLACVRTSDTVARLGGDEFVLMLEHLGADPVEAANQAKSIGEKILFACSSPYFLEGDEFHSTPSIGVALFSGLAQKVEELLKRADLAMYQAKASGRNTLRFFDPQMQTLIKARATMEAELRRAVMQKEFVLYYQPQFDQNSLITGVEALIRWRHPHRGLVLPNEFIELAEDTGFILPLGEWVLETACMQLAAWSLSSQTARISIAVNVSARQFRHPDFVEKITAVLHRTKADPHLLKLELTETLMLDDIEVTITRMNSLKAIGVQFSLDDFGTGYSSLSYLKRLPLSQLKIDQSFVKDALADSNGAAIIRTVIALGQILGLSVMAEGVESQEQRDFLTALGCGNCQGYLFCRPLPINRLEDYMQQLRSGD